MVPNFMGIAPLLVPAGQVVTLAQDIEYKNISVFFFPPINRPFPFMSLLVFPDYFADHMGDYEDVLASLETLNLSILKAMDYTKRVYESGSNVDQFVTRFLLKETANQTQSLLTSSNGDFPATFIAVLAFLSWGCSSGPDLLLTFPCTWPSPHWLILEDNSCLDIAPLAPKEPAETVGCSQGG
uniref:Uncharacterized protein n=1 Tax=Buteo japonicus TaxID=224669 RepID=A0A8B9Z5D4_9AVES